MLEQWGVEPPLAMVQKSRYGVKPVASTSTRAPSGEPAVMSVEETAVQIRIMQATAEQHGRG